jgi:hypothetical protein
MSSSPTSRSRESSGSSLFSYKEPSISGLNPTTQENGAVGGEPSLTRRSISDSDELYEPGPISSNITTGKDNDSFAMGSNFGPVDKTHAVSREYFQFSDSDQTQNHGAHHPHGSVFLSPYAESPKGFIVRNFNGKGHTYKAGVCGDKERMGRIYNTFKGFLCAYCGMSEAEIVKSKFRIYLISKQLCFINEQGTKTTVSLASLKDEKKQAFKGLVDTVCVCGNFKNFEVDSSQKGNIKGVAPFHRLGIEGHKSDALREIGNDTDHFLAHLFEPLMRGKSPEERRIVYYRILTIDWLIQKRKEYIQKTLLSIQTHINNLKKTLRGAPNYKEFKNRLEELEAYKQNLHQVFNKLSSIDLIALYAACTALPLVKDKRPEDDSPVQFQNEQGTPIDEQYLLARARGLRDQLINYFKGRNEAYHVYNKNGIVNEAADREWANNVGALVLQESYFKAYKQGDIVDTSFYSRALYAEYFFPTQLGKSFLAPSYHGVEDKLLAEMLNAESTNRFRTKQFQAVTNRVLQINPEKINFNVTAYGMLVGVKALANPNNPVVEESPEALYKGLFTRTGGSSYYQKHLDYIYNLPPDQIVSVPIPLTPDRNKQPDVADYSPSVNPPAPITIPRKPSRLKRWIRPWHGGQFDGSVSQPIRV